MSDPRAGLARRRPPHTGFGVGVFCAATSLALAEPVTDFSLPDWNETSPRFGQDISPRDYLHQVTAYYFGDPG